MSSPSGNYLNARDVTVYPLRDLRDKYRSELFDGFLPLMDRFVIDYEHGGFMCMTAPDGGRESDSKSSWFEGRGTWVYSFLYNNLAQDQTYLDIARRSIEFVLAAEPAGDRLWPRELTREGTPVASAGGEVYGDLFIAEGLAEFAKATQQHEYWVKAKQIVLKCLRHYDRPNYCPNIGMTYLGPTAPRLPGARILGVWMVLIRVVTQMLEMCPDDDLEQIADRSRAAIMNNHFNPEYRLLNELLNHDLSRPANAYAQLVYTGHAIECLWMLMSEAIRLRDRELFDRFVSWFRRHVEVAWDDVYGGVFHNLQHVKDNRWSTNKLLWAQEEVLIGSLLIVEHTGAAWAEEMFRQTCQYVVQAYPVERHGFRVWKCETDREGSSDTVGQSAQRIENYHHPRHLMQVLSALERMAARELGPGPGPGKVR